jgi:hypothetical protein
VQALWLQAAPRTRVNQATVGSIRPLGNPDPWIAGHKPRGLLNRRPEEIYFTQLVSCISGSITESMIKSTTPPIATTKSGSRIVAIASERR